jgi:acid phosphatase type 7
VRLQVQLVAVLLLAFAILLSLSTFSPPKADKEAYVLAGAGDIAWCGGDGAQRTALLIEQVKPDAVFTLGDNAYENGTAAEFEECYEPTWGRFKDITYPAIGNHDYGAEGYENKDGSAYDATPYFDYFGERAGELAEGWYSYDLGQWHIVILNSMCGVVEGCFRGSPQMRWLEKDLRGREEQCVLAYWHHPMFSSGFHGNDPRMKTAWEILYEHEAELILTGHDHTYERFTPMNPQGEYDAWGLRQFVVGTGGRTLRDFNNPEPGSESALAGRNGILKLTLHPTAYEWEFMTVDGESPDKGSQSCR